ncbi:YkgJ family cysteine cluster protein [Vibrio tubiashii]|uniref:YkgJ family cysteine cluster protein n=1 Tax=Vibrio tubiashii TaxID=29498 RepID=UPI001EFECFD7|nr:YkgJ family cysteine cluster protein [Vibrio tubiashii]MCG9578211.1 YkgJ family cysteine cluster protein [Vibrio tubiashii]
MISQDDFNKRCGAYDLMYRKAKKGRDALKVLSNFEKKVFGEAYKSEPTPACYSGCSHCCHLRVVAYAHELIAIHSYINSSFSPHKRLKVLERLDKQYRRIKDLSEDEHFTINVECPFLENNKCSIYAVRPMTCASYHSCSDTVCKQSYDEPTNMEIEIPLNPKISIEQNVQFAVTEHVIKHHNDDSNKYELLQGLHLLFSNPKAAQRWKSGRKVFKNFA